jgi:hypothetical protein
MNQEGGMALRTASRSADLSFRWRGRGPDRTRRKEEMMVPGTPDHVQVNRQLWERSCHGYQQRHGATLDASPAGWGFWRIPEADLG